ncbi:MAG: hypothetical protein HPY53_01465 [Brevinematales bacterium]|nr:hypothetical protein [Brevinematales bacterium]
MFEDIKTVLNGAREGDVILLFKNGKVGRVRSGSKPVNRTSEEIAGSYTIREVKSGDALAAEVYRGLVFSPFEVFFH